MRNIKWYTWLGIGFVFIILTLVFGKTFSNIEQVAHTEAISVKIESEEVDHQIQLETETKDAGSLTSVKSIPFTKTESIDVPLRNWANEQEEFFFNEMEKTEIMLNEDISAHFSLQSNIKPISEDIYKIIITNEQSVDRTDEYNSKHPFIIDLSSKKILTLTDISNDKLTTDKLFKLLANNSDKELSKEAFQENYPELTDLHWSVNEEKISFFFQPNEITNEQFQIEVPIIDYYNYFNEEYYKAFVTDEMNEKIKEKQAREKKKKKTAIKNELHAKKYVALTFDDGPNPKGTKKILETLKQYNAKATFFTLSNNVKQYPELAKEIIAQGHEIANHSQSHANLNAVKTKKAEKEIIDSQQTIYDITGVKPELYRPPYGNYNEDIEKIISKSNQKIILWSVDTVDWNSKNANAIYNNAKGHTRPGAIILMHDIYPTTADALPKLLKYYEQEGYECVTISELLPFIEDTYNGAYFGY